MIRLEQPISKENQSNNANSKPSDKSSRSAGRWTKEEHQKFIDGLKKFGKNWKQVEDYVGTRNGAQIRSHAQKFFNRLEREYNVKLDGSKKEGGKKNKKSSIRKTSECSVSTSCTNQEAIKELVAESLVEQPEVDEQEAEDEKSVSQIEDESMQNPTSEVTSLPAASPKINPFEVINNSKTESGSQPSKTPRKMSADIGYISSSSYSLFDIIMSTLQFCNKLSNPPRLSDLVQMKSCSQPLSSTMSVNAIPTSASFKPIRKLSDENLSVKDKLNLRKPDYPEYEMMAKKVKVSGEEEEY